MSKQICFVELRDGKDEDGSDGKDDKDDLDEDDDDGSDGSNALVSRETAISVSGVHRGLYRGPGLPPWRHRLVNPAIRPIPNLPP